MPRLASNRLGLTCDYAQHHVRGRVMSGGMHGRGRVIHKSDVVQSKNSLRCSD